jgi:hypothetical protein
MEARLSRDYTGGLSSGAGAGVSAADQLRQTILSGFAYSGLAYSDLTPNVQKYIAGLGNYTYAPGQAMAGSWQVREGYPTDMESVNQLGELERKARTDTPGSLFSALGKSLLSGLSGMFFSGNPALSIASSMLGFAFNVAKENPRAVGVYGPDTYADIDSALGGTGTGNDGGSTLLSPAPVQQAKAGETTPPNTAQAPAVVEDASGQEGIQAEALERSKARKRVSLLSMRLTDPLGLYGPADIFRPTLT